MEVVSDVLAPKPKKPITEKQRIVRQENVKKMNARRSTKGVPPSTPHLEKPLDDGGLGGTSNSDLDEEELVRREVSEIVDNKIALFYAERVKPRIRKLKDKNSAPAALPVTKPKKEPAKAQVVPKAPPPPFSKWD